MPIGGSLKRKLSRRYEPSTMVSLRFRGNDIEFKTNENGEPVALFIGTQRPDGKGIRGERYVRTLKKDAQNNIIKDHWDRKGKTSGR